MASTTAIFLGFTIFLLTSLTVHMANGREVPTENTHLHPEWAGHFDRSVLIPGIGRVIFPKKGSHANPFTYNPVTGGSNGGLTGGHSYVPSGDHTFLSNPVDGEISAPSHP
ncbi:Putative cell wall protein [Striga hermonthica]|uniref:Cell wall protein n=1 Tax=Striga hermonthica TaxID=68872 RepID=A0A9N7RAZ8_STRHE|nr:Putative cell wall protein [Striga hermonthica]